MAYVCISCQGLNKKDLRPDCGVKTTAKSLFYKLDYHNLENMSSGAVGIK